MSINKALGLKIKGLRLQAGLTQQELADKIGVESPSYLSKIETGGASPSYELLGRIAHSLGVALKDLFDKSPSPARTAVKRPDKWILRFKALFKGRTEKEIRSVYYVARKVLGK